MSYSFEGGGVRKSLLRSCSSGIDSEGDCVGVVVGEGVEASVGSSVGSTVGTTVGKTVGEWVRRDMGASVASLVGAGTPPVSSAGGAGGLVVGRAVMGGTGLGVGRVKGTGTGASVCGVILSSSHMYPSNARSPTSLLLSKTKVSTVSSPKSLLLSTSKSRRGMSLSEILPFPIAKLFLTNLPTRRFPTLCALPRPFFTVFNFPRLALLPDLAPDLFPVLLPSLLPDLLLPEGQPLDLPVGNRTDVGNCIGAVVSRSVGTTNGANEGGEVGCTVFPKGAGVGDETGTALPKGAGVGDETGGSVSSGGLVVVLDDELMLLVGAIVSGFNCRFSLFDPSMWSTASANAKIIA